MPSDNPSTSAAKAVDFTDTLAKVKAIAAKIGNSAAAAAAAAPPAPAPASPSVTSMPPAPVAAVAAPSTYGKRPYEEDPYQQGADPYAKRPAYEDYSSHYGSQVSHYAPPMRNEHSVQEDMGVPGHLVGLIIGRGGENLKRIERETGCRIQFTQDGAPNDRERFVNIVGTPAGIADAKRQIQDIIASSMNTERGPPGGGGYGMGGYGGAAYGRASNQSSMQIPGSKVGLVIGRGGETIRDLQDRSGARIAVAPPSAQDHGTNMRTITLTGDDSAIERAKQFIDEIVNDMAPRGTYGGGSGYQSTPTATMQVPQEAIGLVIGRGGETVKQLQIMTRAKIQVQQVDAGAYPPEERTINLYGPPEAVEYARQLIMEKVAGARESDRYGQGRDQGGYGGYSGYQYGAQAGGYDPTYAGYAAAAATSGTPAATTGYTPEQQAAYAQYYAYQYGNAYSYAPVTATPASGESAANTTEAASGDASATPATSGAGDAADASAKASETADSTTADANSTSTTSSAPASAATTSAANPLSSYAYAYANYYAQPAATTSTTTAAGTTDEAASKTESAAEESTSTDTAAAEDKAESKEPAASDASAATPAAETTATDPNAAAAAAAAAAANYAAYYAQQGYSAEAYQQYYAQYYGYQPQVAAGATDAAATTATDASGADTTAQPADGQVAAVGEATTTETVEDAEPENAPSTADATPASADAAPAPAEDASAPAEEAE
ncbi:hypothetical protein BGZ73_003504 [Actinomortierella ambigua]|nr:hypothetical protein BGZ73_003504 [Actinomortierella ambigua]